MQFTVLFLAQSNLLGLFRVLCPVLGIIFVLYLFDELLVNAGIQLFGNPYSNQIAIGALA